MSNIDKRKFLFLFGCIPIRFLFVYLSKMRPELSVLFGTLALIPAIGFAVIYIFGLRKTGVEVFGDKIWWDSLRPMHAFLWGLFAYLAINNNPSAWMVLLIDTFIGLFAWTFFSQ